MSISIGGKIVTNGLLLHYDALNPMSYPGSGTDWDSIPLSTNCSASLNLGSNPITISNGYATLTPGSGPEGFTEDFSLSQFTSYVTIDFWARIRPNAGSGVRKLLGIGDAGAYYVAYNSDAPYFGVGTNGTDVWGLQSATFNSLGILNNWAHYSCVLANGLFQSLPETDQKTYVNGTLPTNGRAIGDDYPSQRSFNTDDFSKIRIGGQYGGTYANADIAIIKVYNRALTLPEITQNFNAHKGRFNIY
jgi:hypothetical protein